MIILRFPELEINICSRRLNVTLESLLDGPRIKTVYTRLLSKDIYVRRYSVSGGHSRAGGKQVDKRNSCLILESKPGRVKLSRPASYLYNREK